MGSMTEFSGWPSAGAGGWVINQWLKKAVLLSFRLHDSAVGGGPAARRSRTRCR